MDSWLQTVCCSIVERSINTTIVYIARQPHNTPRVKTMQGKNDSGSGPIIGLLDIMARLRDPQHGCAWDRQQTWQSILPYTLEEVYEVADAVDRQDAGSLCDELGDLLFQIVFMAQIAQEQELFGFEDVVQGIVDKMIRRHPHVFGDTVYADLHEQKRSWERIKQTERQIKAGQDSHFFSDIPVALPALRRSQKLQQRAARVGFDWDHWQQVIPKIHEELEEVTAAVAQKEPFARVEEEVGDVLMGATNLARLLGVNAENALRLSNRKFERRFLRVEALLRAEGLTLDQANLEQMENAWFLAKEEEKQTSGQ